jgi:hypothetical protein
MEDCEHNYTFLRQEIRPTLQNGDRVLERVINDVFFCTKCLSYHYAFVRKEIPNRQSFGWVEVFS